MAPKNSRRSSKSVAKKSSRPTSAEKVPRKPTSSIEKRSLVTSIASYTSSDDSTSVSSLTEAVLCSDSSAYQELENDDEESCIDSLTNFSRAKVTNPNPEYLPDLLCPSQQILAANYLYQFCPDNFDQQQYDQQAQTYFTAIMWYNYYCCVWQEQAYAAYAAYWHSSNTDRV